MRLRRHSFSLVEVVVVTVLLALVSAVVLRSLFNRGDRSSHRQVQLQIQEIFNNAAIRAQSFEEEVQVAVRPAEIEGEPIQIDLKSPPESNISSTAAESLSEEEHLSHQQLNYARKIWSGEDRATLPEQVSLIDYEELTDDDGLIYFTFYPDGEATGPMLIFRIGEDQYPLQIDRLNSQVYFPESRP